MSEMGVLDVVPLWTDLPEDILAWIARCLNSDIDVLRIRAVCKSWRSSVPLQKPHPFPHKLPFPICKTDLLHPKRKGYFSLSHTTTCLIEPLRQIQCRDIGASSSSYQALLVRIKTKKNGKLCITNPFSGDSTIGFSPRIFPKSLNLLDYRVTEVSKSYSICFNNRSSPDVPQLEGHRAHIRGPEARKELNALQISRVVCSSLSSFKPSALLGTYNRGKLFSMKVGDKKWTVFDNVRNSHYEDVAIYKGKFYALQDSGTVTVFRSSLELAETIPSPMGVGGGGQMYLMESFGDLLLVHADLDPPAEFDHYFSRYLARYDLKTKTYIRHDGITHQALRFKVYNLDEGKGIWKQVKSLEDRALFVGEDCRFSVLARDSAGCRGNCIYYQDHLPTFDREYDDSLRGLNYHEIGVFSFVEGVGGPLVCFPGYADILWPPPAWLSPNPSSSGCQMLGDEEEDDQPVGLTALSSIGKF